MIAATSRPAIRRHYHPKHHPTTGMSYLWKRRILRHCDCVAPVFMLVGQIPVTSDAKTQCDVLGRLERKHN